MALTMPSVTFRVPFVKGKARPRFSRGHAYTPKATSDAQETIAASYVEACCGDALKASDGVPVAVAVLTTRNVKSGFRRRDGDAHDDLQKPDADNIAKLVLDALNGVAYEDDSQVFALYVLKLPRRRGNEPTTYVGIFWGDDE